MRGLGFRGLGGCGGIHLHLDIIILQWRPFAIQHSQEPIEHGSPLPLLVPVAIATPIKRVQRPSLVDSRAHISCWNPKFGAVYKNSNYDCLHLSCSFSFSLSLPLSRLSCLYPFLYVCLSICLSTYFPPLSISLKKSSKILQYIKPD